MANERDLAIYDLAMKVMALESARASLNMAASPPRSMLLNSPRLEQAKLLLNEELWAAQDEMKKLLEQQ